MKKMSSKQLIIMIQMIFIVPMLVLLVFYNVYTTNTLNRKIADVNKNTVLLYNHSLQLELDDIEKHATNFLANDSDMQRMQYQLTSLDAYLVSTQVMRKYRTVMGAKDVMAAFFFYSEKNHVSQQIYNRTYSYLEKKQTETFVKESISEDSAVCSKGWFLHVIEERPFLFRFLKNQGVYMICTVDLDYVQMPQKLASYPGSEFLFFTDEAGEPLTEKRRLSEAGIQPEISDKLFSVKGLSGKKYMVVQQTSQNGGVTLMCAAPYQGVLMNMNVTQSLLLIMSVAIVLLIFFSYNFLRRFFLQPFNALVVTMEQVKQGKLDAKLEVSQKTDEFVRLQNTFNGMIDEIHNLRIASYEQRLENQQVELQYLQIQIRPHFFLNCLKNLYALAQEKKLDQIQEMILALSAHLRFLFRETRAMVPISDEIKSVQNYIALQQMVMPTPPILTVELDPRLQDMQFPPLSLLTFVENSIKYGEVPGKALNIFIRISLLEDGQESFVDVVVQDNGNGFSEESLKNLQENSRTAQHIGIQNVCRRFQLLYGEKSTFLFSNRGGAEIEIFFPFSREGGEEKTV